MVKWEGSIIFHDLGEKWVALVFALGIPWKLQTKEEVLRGGYDTAN